MMQKKILISLGVTMVLALLSLAVLGMWPISKSREQALSKPIFASRPEPTRSAPRIDESTPARSVTVPAPAIPWEQRLDEILNAPGDSGAAARALLQALPGLPVEAQEQFTASALELSRNGDFSSAAAVYFRSGTTPSVALEIFDEALNRSDSIKLPFLAETADQPNHPLAGEARGLLELYMELKPGTVPPGAWGDAVREYLKKNRKP